MPEAMITHRAISLGWLHFVAAPLFSTCLFLVDRGLQGQIVSGGDPPLWIRLLIIFLFSPISLFPFMAVPFLLSWISSTRLIRASRWISFVSLIWWLGVASLLIKVRFPEYPVQIYAIATVMGFIFALEEWRYRRRISDSAHPPKTPC